MPQYSWITYSAARQALAARLADPNMLFWSDSELKIWITEALRTWNALTEIWNADFAFSATSSNTWYNLATSTGYPRLRTVSDSDIYTAMEASLLEPQTGGTWTGTSQFSIADLSGALQRRRDEIIQVSGCNLQSLSKIPTSANVSRVFLPDTTIEPRRVRFLPATGSNVTLTREDMIAFDAFEQPHVQQWKLPTSWSVIAGPPLAMDVDTAPNVNGNYDVIALQSGPTFAPPTVTPVFIPDDWSWLAKWGALSDLLGRESEATDRPRAAYCIQRYQQGLEIMKASNWLVTGRVNGVPVDTPSLFEMDAFSPEWQDDPSVWPTIVQAGMDFVAPCPVGAAQVVGVSMTVVGNAPIPVLDGDFVQVSRDVFDVILDYAQVVASFKMGGSEFRQTKDLEKNFFAFAVETNKRLSNMGLFADIVHSEGKRQDEVQPR